MDKQTIAVMIPLVALLIPVAAIVMGGLQKIWRLRIEEARARAGALGRSAEEVESLRADVADLREELTDVQERLDFTERMLARSREREGPPGATDVRPGSRAGG